MKVLCCVGDVRGGDGSVVPGLVLRATGGADDHVHRGAGPTRLHAPHGPRQRSPHQVPRLPVRLEPPHPCQGTNQGFKKVGSPHDLSTIKHLFVIAFIRAVNVSDFLLD